MAECALDAANLGGEFGAFFHRRNDHSRRLAVAARPAAGNQRQKRCSDEGVARPSVSTTCVGFGATETKSCPL